jgi:hypothetical protein
VLPYQAGARLLRLGVGACFLLAFGLPVAPAIVVAAVLAQGSGAAMPIPGAGPAAIGAALLVALPFAAGHALDGGAWRRWPWCGPRRSRSWAWPSRSPSSGHLCGARTPRRSCALRSRCGPQPAPIIP